VYQHFLFYPAEYGALTQLWAGTCAETKDLNSKFLIPWARVGEPSSAIKNQDNQAKLWEWITEQRKSFGDGCAILNP